MIGSSVIRNGSDEGHGMSVRALRRDGPGTTASESAPETVAAPDNATPARRAKSQKWTAGKRDDGWHRFAIDVWLTDFNSTEFGIYKRARNRAKSRQFSNDMDIFAEVVENGERTGLIGYRADLWKTKTGMDKRLVFKLFSDSLNWRATMDLMVARSLQLTLGARGLPVLAYSINGSDDDFVVYLERSANKWPLLPEHFSLFLMHEGKPVFYRLRRDVIALGGDYTLYDHNDRLVGRLDGKIFTLGGYWRGQVRRDHADKRLLNVLKLFGGMIGFNRACRRHMKQLWSDIRQGRLETKLERQEADLYANPRRVH
jgi:hypothetical protein